MSSALLIGLEMSLVLGGVLGFGFWELWRLRRDRAKAPDREAKGDATDGPTSSH